MNETYGWFDDASSEIAYDPPHNAPCLYCGLRLTPGNIRTHSVMSQFGAERSYFYRTHRTCDDGATESQKQAIMGGVLDRIGHDLGIGRGEPII